jgi:hypothetical protein
MSNKQFEWTDELVKEFMIYYSEIDSVVDGVDPILKEAQKFKKDWEKRNAPIPEYEILSFRDPCSDAQHRIVAYQSHHLTYEQWSQSWLNAKAPIHSIRRTKDGEVFTVGDTVRHVDGDYTNDIKGFYLPCDDTSEVWFYWTDFKETVKSLDNFKKDNPQISPPKSPLFRTEDGVDIYEGGEIWVVGTWYNCFYDHASKEQHEAHKEHCKYFSNRYNSERYVLMNKPALSINDVMFFFEATKDADTFLGAITEKVKEKL